MMQDDLEELNTDELDYAYRNMQGCRVCMRVGCLSMLFVVIITIIICFFSSCKTIQPQNNLSPNTHTEYNVTRHNDIQHDTLIGEHYRYVYIGDTVHILDSIIIYEKKDVKIIDTIRVNTIDTIHPDPIIMEKPLSKGDVFLKRSGIALWVIMGIILLSIIIGIIIKFSK